MPLRRDHDGASPNCNRREARFIQKNKRTAQSRCARTSAVRTASGRHGLGVALKIEDGDDQRARPPAVIEALLQLEVLSNQDLKTLSGYAPTPITNRRGERVGEARAAFTLEIRRLDRN